MEEICFPNNIAVIRKIRGLTQAYVAEQIGVSRPKYIEIERGTKELTISQVEKLKEVLDVSFNDLIGLHTGRINYKKILKGIGDKKKEEEKHFEEWIEVKEKLHYRNAIPRIKEGEIWWCSCGENVGVEINGKSGLFSRPVFVLKKLSELGFIGVPLTSQNKEGSWFVSFDFQGKKQTAVLAQLRTFSVARLSNRMGELDAADSEKIKESLIRLLK